MSISLIGHREESTIIGNIECWKLFTFNWADDEIGDNHGTYCANENEYIPKDFSKYLLKNPVVPLRYVKSKLYDLLSIGINEYYGLHWIMHVTGAGSRSLPVLRAQRRFARNQLIVTLILRRNQTTPARGEYLDLSGETISPLALN